MAVSAHMKQPFGQRRRRACSIFRRGVKHNHGRGRSHQLGQDVAPTSDWEVPIKEAKAHAAGPVAPRQIRTAHGPRLIVKTCKNGQSARSSKRLFRGHHDHVGPFRARGWARWVSSQKFEGIHRTGPDRRRFEAKGQPFLQVMKARHAGVKA